MLSHEQLSYLKEILLGRKTEIEDNLENNDYLNIKHAHIKESIGELSNYDNHPADTGTALFEREKDIALLEHYERELKDIEHVLDEIEKGNYGNCEVCNQEIPFERLKALPTTTFCIEHSPDKKVSTDRPVEEDVLFPPFGKFEYDENATFFDAEDAWQEVARYGTSETPSGFSDPEMLDYNSMLIEEDETVGYVEEIESFIGTDMEGNNPQIYPNAIHEKYEERLDEDGVMSVVGNLGTDEENNPYKTE